MKSDYDFDVRFSDDPRADGFRKGLLGGWDEPDCPFVDGPDREQWLDGLLSGEIEALMRKCGVR